MNAQSRNPFRKRVTRTPWQDVSIVPELNAPAWQDILTAIQDCVEEPECSQMVMLAGQVGAGKTTLLGRCRSQASTLGCQFAYVPPLPTSIDMVGQLTAQIVACLDRPAEGEPLSAPFLEHLALTHLRRGLQLYACEQPDRWFCCFKRPQDGIASTTLLDLDDESLRRVTGRLDWDHVRTTIQEAARRDLPGVHERVLQVVLGLAFDGTAPGARRWLRGDSLTADDQVALRLPPDVTWDAIGRLVLQSLLWLLDRPLIVAIDELEVMHATFDATAYGHLINTIRTIYNNTPRLVLLLCGQRDILDQIAKEYPAVLQRLNAGRISLLGGLSPELARQLVAHLDPTWDDDELIQNAYEDSAGNTRLFLTQMARYWGTPRVKIGEVLARRLAEHVADERSKESTPPEREAGLRAAIREWLGLTSALKVTDGWLPPGTSAPGHTLDLLLEGEADRIGLQVSLSTSPKVLDSLFALRDELSRSCVVVPANVTPSWQFDTGRGTLQERFGPRFSLVKLTADDLAHLIGAHRLIADVASRQISDLDGVSEDEAEPALRRFIGQLVDRVPGWQRLRDFLEGKNEEGHPDDDHNVRLVEVPGKGTSPRERQQQPVSAGPPVRADRAQYCGLPGSPKFHNVVCGHAQGRDSLVWYESRREAIADGRTPCGLCCGV